VSELKKLSEMLTETCNTLNLSIEGAVTVTILADTEESRKDLIQQLHQGFQPHNLSNRHAITDFLHMLEYIDVLHGSNLRDSVPDVKTVVAEYADSIMLGESVYYLGTRK